jgi:hypothetical protein
LPAGAKPARLRAQASPVPSGTLSPLVSMERLASDCPNARTGARADRARIHKDAVM